MATLPLHPTHTSDQAAVQAETTKTQFHTPLEAVDHFAETISQPEFLSNDYGDWMRKVDHELMILSETLVGTSPEIQSHLLKMHDYIRLEPDWNIMNTLRRALNEVILIRKELGAHDTKTLADYKVSVSDQDPEYVTH
jgi:hypothetical protein